ncbi:MAG: 16S rRNA (guanine(966)-N(2))-methyltransferase RsmD [Candidatus Omnitrophota bacterium]|nr:16S rRNA (guanine(966)-N(2))-methyltransferase RsmD [Candidatus Omnitrophota bacterium]
MRITTGKYRNRKIYFPRGIRPTQDKVRKAIFDILGDIDGLSFLELCAGSGAVSFEALSRGISELTLVECNHGAILAIKRNIESLKASSCNLYYLDAHKAIKLLALDKKCFDLIFFDPPYHEDMAKKILQTLEAYDILAPNGLIIAQHPKAELLPKDSEKFSLVKEAKYGDTWLSIFRKKE